MSTSLIDLLRNRLRYLLQDYNASSEYPFSQGERPVSMSVEITIRIPQPTNSSLDGRILGADWMIGAKVI